MTYVNVCLPNPGQYLLNSGSHPLRNERARLCSAQQRSKRIHIYRRYVPAAGNCLGYHRAGSGKGIKQVYAAIAVSSYLVKGMTHHVRNHHGWVLEIAMSEAPTGCSSKVPKIRIGRNESVEAASESHVVRMN